MYLFAGLQNKRSLKQGVWENQDLAFQLQLWFLFYSAGKKQLCFLQNFVHRVFGLKYIQAVSKK